MTTILSVVVAAQPDVGVKVYVVVPVLAVLIVAGLQVPVIPLVDVAGNTGAVLFWHKGPIDAKEGTVGAFTTILIVVVLAQPEEGVKVYVLVPAVAVLIVAGLQVPVIPLVELAGNAGAVLFWQSGPIAVNAGTVAAFTTIFIVTGAAHPPEGVNVYVVVPAVAVLIVAGLQVPATPLVDVAGNAGAVLF